MSDKHKDKSHEKEKSRKVKITTGPFLVPEEVDSELQGGRDNDRIIIILKNPTDKHLKVKVKLGICLEPRKSASGLLNVYKDIEEKEVSLGWFTLKPHSCTRIERNIPRDLGSGKDERNAVYRITAKGDFQVCSRGDTVLCGLAEISVIGGSVFNFEEPGLEQADAALFFPFSNFVVCKSH
ncbi:hypothetical protein AWM68_01775 [Fictibacillus phosphorivorans]|uniref:Uncharacterized protein n=1 Tax=Fictibacillus phosphorivorans TaxID=1221500 RepID=A0A161TRL4_9BACL|nr:hypothetical protein [Fictibacillus phosphorivorans]KZE69021.1 hypothetical protein AWM68_01775 [Fictibacillus phosphorivorans]